jgi:hypothetical protein
MKDKKEVKRPRLVEQVDQIVKHWLRGCFWRHWLEVGCPGDDETLKALVKEGQA